ncbi:MAG TPA: Ltp family lipoprotein, partial [Phycicoccus sp.]|nr:Ltp family lipoprotein [Phycicoccus sp.]
AVEDATAAVDSLTVDWNEQAAKAAKAYVSMTGFSCQGLIDQLASDYGDKFTVEQATYGAKQTSACG